MGNPTLERKTRRKRRRSVGSVGRPTSHCVPSQKAIVRSNGRSGKPRSRRQKARPTRRPARDNSGTANWPKAVTGPIRMKKGLSVFRARASGFLILGIYSGAKMFLRMFTPSIVTWMKHLWRILHQTVRLFPVLEKSPLKELQTHRVLLGLPSTHLAFQLN